jgi:hypothetical protein
MMMSRVSYRERQAGGQQRVLQTVMRNFHLFNRRATLFCCLGASDFRASLQRR